MLSFFKNYSSLDVAYAGGLALTLYAIWRLCLRPLLLRTVSSGEEELKGDAEGVFRPPPLPSPCPKHFTVDELAKFTTYPIYISIMGRVYDVSSHPSGVEFYGPGGPYSFFAGKDATVGLAKMSLDATDARPSQWQLDISEKQVLSDWLDKFESKYTVVGKVVYGITEEDAIVNKSYCSMEKQRQKLGEAPSSPTEDLTDPTTDFYRTTQPDTSS